MIVYVYFYLFTLPKQRTGFFFFLDYFSRWEKAPFEQLLHDELLNVFTYINGGLYANKVSVCNSRKDASVAGCLSLGSMGEGFF